MFISGGARLVKPRCGSLFLFLFFFLLLLLTFRLLIFSLNGRKSKSGDDKKYASIYAPQVHLDTVLFLTAQLAQLTLLRVERIESSSSQLCAETHFRAGSSPAARKDILSLLWHIQGRPSAAHNTDRQDVWETIEKIYAGR